MVKLRADPRADLEQCNIEEHLPVMQLLLDLAKVQLFPPLNSQAMALVAQMMSSCSSTHYKHIRAMGVQIVHELSQVCVLNCAVSAYFKGTLGGLSTFYSHTRYAHPPTRQWSKLAFMTSRENPRQRPS